MKLTFTTAALAALIAFSFSSCTEKKENTIQNGARLMFMREMPEANIISISQEDSIFGKHYMSTQQTEEVNGVIADVVKEVADLTAAAATGKSFTKQEKEIINLYMSMLDKTTKELKASNSKKEDFSGYLVRIDYKATTKSGESYKAERWMYMNKELTAKVRQFEFPLPR